MLGLELLEQAVADARENASLNNISNCDFYSGPAEEILQSVVNKAKFDNVVAVVDPPRAGLRKFPPSLMFTLKHNAENMVIGNWFSTIEHCLRIKEL